MIIPIALRVGFMSFPPLENAGTRQMPHRNIDDGPEDQVMAAGLNVTPSPRIERHADARLDQVRPRPDL
jgi:hypothetical protein